MNGWQFTIGVLLLAFPLCFFAVCKVRAQDKFAGLVIFLGTLCLTILALMLAWGIRLLWGLLP